MTINTDGQAIYGACVPKVRPFSNLGLTKARLTQVKKRSPIVLETPQGNLDPDDWRNPAVPKPAVHRPQRLVGIRFRRRKRKPCRTVKSNRFSGRGSQPTPAIILVTFGIFFRIGYDFRRRDDRPLPNRRDSSNARSSSASALA